MAVSRPVLLALLGSVLAVALFFATMGSRGTSEDPAPAPQPATKQDSSGAAAPSQRPSATKSSSAVDATGKRRLSAADARAAADRRAAAAKAKAKPKAASVSGVPDDVTRALERKRTVVLFFFQRGSADDDATAKAVASMKGRSGVKVFSVPISRLADYRGVTGGAGVTQAPAVVILDSQRKARLIEGFVDRETLAQEVTDAR